MATENNLGSGAFGSPEEGRAASAVGNATVNSRLNVDLTMIKGLNSELKDLSTNAKAVQADFKKLVNTAKDITKEFNNAAKAMGGVSGKKSSSTTYVPTMPSAATKAPGGDSEAAEILKVILGSGGGGAGKGGGISGGLFAKMGGAKGVGNYIGKAAETGINLIDSRIESNQPYALAADRLSVQLQQMHGVTQNAIANSMRKPLTNYKIGADGINSLLSLQARTGLNAGKMGSSVEALRAVGGYQQTGSQIVNQIESMADPDVVNRMFMMTGTSIYGIGGAQKSPMQVTQDLTNKFGLNNKRMIEASQQKGSAVRQRMAQAGIGEEMQSQILQYAMGNQTYKEKGGEGMYDPSREKDRRITGIADNYATQSEETERIKTNRDENMYRRQADNYADLEKNTQRLTEAFGKLEDKLSGIIGARAGNPIFGKGGIGSKLLGAGMMAGGLALSMAPIPGIGQVAGLGLMGAGAGIFSGDPKVTGPTGATPGAIAKTKPTSKKSGSSMLGELKPVLRQPLEKLLQDRPGISIGQAYRSPQAQKKMFLERHTKTDQETDTYYDGSYWKLKPGYPMAAPPGLSYHEIGLAADLVFASSADEAWLKLNASTYNLDEFSRHGEPWHVQAKGYPASRRQYEAQGATYGTDNNPATRYKTDTQGSIQESGPYGQQTSGGAKAQLSQQLSMASSMAAFSKRRNARTDGSEDRITSGRRAGSGNTSGTGVGAPGKGGAGTVSAAGINGGAGSPSAAPGVLAERYGSNMMYRITDNYASGNSTGWRGYWAPDHPTDGDLMAIAMAETGGGRAEPEWTRNITNSHGNLMGGFVMNQYNWDRGGGKKFAMRPDLATPEQQMIVAKKLLNPINNRPEGANKDLGWLQDGFETIVNGSVAWESTGGVKTPGILNAQPPVKSDDPTKPPKRTWGYEGGDPSNTTRASSVGSPSLTSPIGTMSRVSTNNVFTVAPVFNITSTGSTDIDMQNLAKEISRVLDNEVRLAAMRSE